MKYRKLPHIDLIDHYQFVTFRTADSVDEFVRRVRYENISNSQKEYRIDNYLDSSKKGCYLNGEVLDYLREFLISKDRTFYDLVSFVIMPNHIHTLFKQNSELSLIVKNLKGGSAVGINRVLNRSGKFWESNYYDRAIRDEKHLEVTYSYIRDNPLKVGLDLSKRFYSVYE
jgi:REP element-mobilizing transposase RayT